MDMFEAPALISRLKAEGYPIRKVEVNVETQQVTVSTVGIRYLHVSWMEDQKSGEFKKAS